MGMGHHSGTHSLTWREVKQTKKAWCRQEELEVYEDLLFEHPQISGNIVDTGRVGQKSDTLAWFGHQRGMATDRNSKWRNVSAIFNAPDQLQNNAQFTWLIYSEPK